MVCVWLVDGNSSEPKTDMKRYTCYFILLQKTYVTVLGMDQVQI